MYTNANTINVKGTDLKLHATQLPLQVDTTNKVIAGQLASFKDDSITNNWGSTTARPAKVSRFVIQGGDVVVTGGVMDVDASVKNYLDANLATVINAAAPQA